MDQFKLLALRYQQEKENSKKTSKRKAEEDIFCYISNRSFRIRKRCGYS
jgi:hypothetical protein